jgi:hypothetical protein
VKDQKVKDGFDAFEGLWLLSKSMKKSMQRITRAEEFWILSLRQKVVPSIITIEDNTRRTAWWIEERIRESRVMGASSDEVDMEVSNENGSTSSTTS